MQTFRGAKNYILGPARQFAAIKAVVERISEAHNYSPCFTSLIDSRSLYRNTLGGQSDIVAKEMFELQYKGFVLRPEGTANLMQYVLKENLHVREPLPLKLYYLGPMFRHERPQKGRYRQFWQYGLEYISSKEEPVQEVDIIRICDEILEGCGVSGEIELNINTIGSIADRDRYSRYITDHFDARPALKAELSVDSQKRLKENPLRILDSKDQRDQEIVSQLQSLGDFVSSSSKRYFEHVKDLLSHCKVEFKVSPTLVRGLDYYNDFCFEYLIKEQGQKSQNAVIAGGRYNSLPNKISGSDKHQLYSIGFAMGIDRLIDNLGHKLSVGGGAKGAIGIGVVLEDSEDKTSQLYAQANQVESLVKARHPTDRYYITKHDFGKAFNYFESKGIAVCILIGEDEANSRTVTVRELNSKTQKTTKASELLAVIDTLIER